MNEKRQTRAKESDEFLGSTVVKIKLSDSSRRATSGRPYDTGLFTGDCLKIFSTKTPYSDSKENATGLWDDLLKKETDLYVHRSPRNAFEEMANLTEEGKLWHYPIDNEQGLLEESNVPFYEHVLLEDLIQDFPKEGPVRDFMELIVIGLSHNPYITVERKHETINYYRDFFKDKDLLVNYSIKKEQSATA